jgi:hypothetical protein
VATIDDPGVIRKIFIHLGLPTDVSAPGRGRATCSTGDLNRPPLALPVPAWTARCAPRRLRSAGGS